MKAFGKEVAIGYAKGDIRSGVWNLSQTSEGTLYPGKARIFPSSAHADVANREVFPVMGFRLFYGKHSDGHVVEFIKKGRILQGDMKRIRGVGVLWLWSSTFTAKTWLIDGQERMTKYHVDLSPVETTKEAMRWGQARGHFNPTKSKQKRNPHIVSFICENCNHVFDLESSDWIPPKTYTGRYQCPKCQVKHATVVMYKIQWKKNPGKAYHLDRVYNLDKELLFTEFHNMHDQNNRVTGAVDEARKSAMASGASDYEVGEYRRRATRDFKGHRNPVYGYIGFYKGKQFEVYAGSTLEAQTKIAREQKIKKSWEITVMLAEKEGKPVTHLPLFNPTHSNPVQCSRCKSRRIVRRVGPVTTSRGTHTKTYWKCLQCSQLIWENPMSSRSWKGRKKDHEWMIVAQQHSPSYREFYYCELCGKYEDSDGKRYTSAQFKKIKETQELYEPDSSIRLNPLAGFGSYIVAGLGLGIGSVLAHDTIKHVKKSAKRSRG